MASIQVNGTHLIPALSGASQRVKQMKQELIRRVDKWASQLPIRLLTSILEFSSIKEIAASQAVCGSWRLPQNLSDRLWRRRYEADWEAETAHDARIAVGGAATSWEERYKRRHQTEQNWLAGRFRESQLLQLNGVTSLSVHKQMLAVLCQDGSLALFDLAVSPPAPIASVKSDGAHWNQLALTSKLVISMQTPDCRAFSVPDLKEVRRLPERSMYVEALAAHEETAIISATRCLIVWRPLLPEADSVKRVPNSANRLCVTPDWARDVVFSKNHECIFETRISTAQDLRSVPLSQPCFYCRLTLDPLYNRLLLRPAAWGSSVTKLLDSRTLVEVKEMRDHPSMSDEPPVLRGQLIVSREPARGQLSLVHRESLAPVRTIELQQGQSGLAATPLLLVTMIYHGTEARDRELCILDFTPEQNGHSH